MADTERRISQLNNDVYAIYDQLTIIQQTQQSHGRQLTAHGRQLAEHGRQLTEHGRQLTEHGRQLTEHGRQLTEHGRQLASLNDTVTRIWTTQQDHGERLNHLDSAIAVLTEKVEGYDERFAQVDKRFGQIDARFGAIDERLDEQGRKLDLIIEALHIRAN
ncbi:hypothetical protein [Actinoallomurus rhizosphaericola]|uniref:hypothetical protein n=1 Tax=Actinoallomurus rhizosphaericola TaxID=2952536 RepID=UPI0020920446|nr:hypothetical protein [Actinoallomurus rhizosphaericola]MCO5998117.1 hypothetical protein [Actinoallomurus rhizosphaericola]